MPELDRSGNRRDFIKKAAYVVPAVMSVSVALVSARAGSHDPVRHAKGTAIQRGARDGERAQRRSNRGK